MKKTIQSFLTLLLFIAIAQIGFSQPSPMYQRNNDGSWTLGINAGAAWQDSDIRSQPGWGVGLTLGKNIWHRPGGFIDVDVRGRLLYTQTYGKDNLRDFSIGVNPVFNGTSGELLNYADDPGYLFQNHKTGIGELSLEGVLTANKLREKTGVILSVFGGIGADLYQTRTDQIDHFGSAYDYSLINAEANRGFVLRELNNMRDGEYETNADGYQNGARISIMPSWGLGLGYQLTPTFSVGMEHKVTYALNDVLEGQRYASNTALTGENDKYHYTSLYLRWKINGKDRYYDDPVSEGPGVIEPALPDPIVNITKPRDRAETRDSKVAVTATIEHVTNKRDIEFKVNGRKVTNFTFNERTDKFASVVSLIPGYNAIEIYATNSVGSDRDEVSVFYEEIIPVDPVYPSDPVYNDNNNPRPPTVQINVPSSDPAYTDNPYGVIKATIKEVQNRNGITFTINGYPSNDFNFDSYANSFVANPEWKNGRNEIVISAVNIAGTDSDSRTIYYEVEEEDNNKPTVDIYQPDRNPYTTESPSVIVKASITNVNSANDVTMTINGSYSNNFRFNPSTGIASATINNLERGTTRIVFKATNAYGSDTDSQSVVYCPSTYGPSVSITKPSSNPYTTSSSSTLVLASVYGISSRDQITFRVNGNNSNDFSYDSSNQTFASTISLSPGNNNVSISVATNGGSDSDSRTIIYNQPIPKPVVTITKPTTDPHTANEKVEFIEATIQNVSSRNDVSLTVNGISTNSFSFNTYNGSFSAEIPLVVGNNEVIISASNAAGSDSDDVTIYYAEPIPAPTVTITVPNQNPFNTNNESVTIKAKITDIPSKRGINFRWRGATVNNYSYNSSTGILEGRVTARPGNNTVSITVTNAAGSDSDSQTIIYNQPIPKPVVTITKPTSDPHTANEKVEFVEATILNVSSRNDVTLTVNGASTNNFSFNTYNGSFSAEIPLVVGNNEVVISASNAAGSDSDDVTIYYAEPIPKPVVNITQPGPSHTTTEDDEANIRATVLHVKSKLNISFKVNGRSSKNFSYNASTNVLTATIPLNLGKNTVYISATNAAGKDSDSRTINYEKKDVVIEAPVIRPNVTITRPARNNEISQSEVYKVQARITGLTGASTDKVTFTVNGRSFRNFAFNHETTQFSATISLEEGNNRVEITASNTAGSDKDSKTIIYDCGENPRFDFRNPLNSPMTVTHKDFRMSLFVHNADKDDVTVWQNGRVRPFQFNETAKFLECVMVLSPGQNILKVRADNACGSKTETVIVNYTAPNTNQGNTSKKPPSSSPTTKPPVTKPSTSSGTSSGTTNPSRNPTVNQGSSSGKVLSPKNPPVTKPAISAKPSVTLISPTSSSKAMAVKGSSAQVKARVTGVAGKSNIRILVNGKPTSSFSYNGSTKMIEANIALKAGGNTKIDIIAVNSKGQAKQTMNLSRK
ncbi:MAG: hypothetical protein AAF502_20955 [Bacteroidota bacterium]